MIGIDANVLVRFLTRDDPDAFEKAASFFSKRSSSDPAYLSSVALAEAIWVLRRGYRYSKKELADVLSRLLSTNALVIGGSEALKTSNGLVDTSMIADHLIAHFCKAAGCNSVVTFDKRAAQNVPGMELLT